MPEVTGQDTPVRSEPAPLAPETAAPSPAAAEPTGQRDPARQSNLWRALRERWPLLAVVIGLVALTMIPLASSDLGQTVTPTPTIIPTTTAPAPTVPAGYTAYADSAEGFALAFPQGWECGAANPGMECVDNARSPSFTLQVQQPSSWVVSRPDDPGAWLDHALSAFAQQPHQTFERAPGPGSIATFAGATWETATGIITVTQPPALTPTVPVIAGATPASTSTSAPTPAPVIVTIRVQVYATIVHERAYIIALFAPTDRFDEGTSKYFQPMLKTFYFLTPTS
ncbi:MAG TPA: hypothetical protein VF807_06240 [Ktedonobacterales bacterium]